MQQIEITKRIPLLNENGNLTQPGWARSLLPAYRRGDIKAKKTRIKEWDYYLVYNDRFALALTIDDNAYMGLDSISLLDFEQGWEITKSPLGVAPMGKKKLPETSAIGDVKSAGRGYGLHFKNDGRTRTLVAHMKNFGPEGSLYARVELTDEPEDSIVIATPFDTPQHFYYNQKINCLRASGEISYGNRTYIFYPSESFGVLDWGRGVWTYSNTWYWGSASGLADGVPFGFNIGYGFGNTSAATENALFYDGRAHKLSHVSFNIPMLDSKEDYMSPWTFTSDDGRLEMDFVPVLDRASRTSAGVIESDQHQVFGRFTGSAVLDDGPEIKIKDFMGFAEKVANKW